MIDELIVCIVILILTVIIAAIMTVYMRTIAITRAEDYHKNEGDIIRDPADKFRRVPEDIHPGGQSEGCSEVCIREDSGSKNNRY